MFVGGVGGEVGWKYSAREGVRKHSAQTKKIRTKARGNKVKQSKCAQGEYYTLWANTILRLAPFLKSAAILSKD